MAAIYRGLSLVMAVRAADILLAALLLLLSMGTIQPVFATDNGPLLQIDTGGHRAFINALVYSKDGNTLYSAGQDKIIRVWDVKAGETIRTIRGQIGPGYDGSIRALALSPDEKFIAVGGRMQAECKGHCGDIRVFDTATGKLVRTLTGGHKGTVSSLAFSSDGLALASGGFVGQIAIWDQQNENPIHILKGHTGNIGRLLFIGKTKKVVSVSSDRSWRIWDTESGSEEYANSDNSNVINAVAISPTDDLIVTAGNDRIVRFWNTQTQTPVHVTEPAIGPVRSLVFTPDGHHLLVGLGTNLENQSVIMDIKTAKPPVILENAGTLTAAAASPDGKSFAIASGASIELRDVVTGKKLAHLAGRGLPKMGVAFDNNGNLAWGSQLNPDIFQKLNTYMQPGGPLEGIPDDEFNLQTKIWSGTATSEDLKFFENPEVQARAKVFLDQSIITQLGDLNFSLRLPNKTRSGLAGQLGVPRPLAAKRKKQFNRVRHKIGSYAAKQTWRGVLSGPLFSINIFKDNKRTSPENGLPGGCSVDPFTLAGDEKKMFVVRGGCTPSQFSTEGKLGGHFVGHQGNVIALAVSPDQTLLATGSADQTVRLWNIATRELIASLFQATDGEWILWTPQGYYTASPRGDRMVGWQINQGPSREAKFVSAQQLGPHFYRPDIISRAIELRSAAAAINEAREADPESNSFSLDQLAKREPPEFKVSTIDKTDGEFAEVTIEVVDNDDPISGLNILVNDTQVTPSELRNFEPTRSGRQLRKIRIPLQPGQNRIQVTASNAVGRTTRGHIILRSNTAPVERRGTLYIVAIGVNTYDKTVGLSNLKFAAADADAFHKRVARTLGTQHKNTKTLLVSSSSGKDPTSSNVRRALRFFRKATPQDTTVIFLAGHGVQDGPDYLFLPSNAKRVDDDWDPDSVVLWSTLEAAISRAKGRRLLFVDTCRSGGAYNARLIKDTADSGVIAFSATNSEALAEERADLGHGVFTYALLKGLEGEADVFPAGAPDGEINMYELAAFVTDKVKRMTNKAQRPELNARKFSDFVFAKVEPSVTSLRD